MKKIFLFTIIFTLSLYSCKSNYTRIGDKNANYIPYYLKVYEADSLYLIGNYKQSHKILDSLFKKFEPVNNDYSHEYGIYLITCVATDDTIGIKDKISYSFKNFGALHAPIHPIENYIFLDKIYKKDSIKYLKLKEKYLKKINYSILINLQEMTKNDQDARALNDIDSATRIKSIDSINKIKLEKIIKKNFYPNYHIVGYYEPGLNDFAQISTLLMHQDRETVFNYLPVILDAVKKGKCSPYEYAVIYDKCMWVYGNKNEMQKYNMLETETKNESDSIVNINRRIIGLPSIYYTRWKNKINNF